MHIICGGHEPQPRTTRFAFYSPVGWNTRDESMNFILTSRSLGPRFSSYLSEGNVYSGQERIIQHPIPRKSISIERL